jgi:hypothetical protein
VLNENNIKAELSYSHLHAVAARAGFGCRVCDRHLDGRGVDAEVTVAKRLDPRSFVKEFSVHFQLKATSQLLGIVNECLSFPLDVNQYDKLRSNEIYIPRFMVVLQLPESNSAWLTVSSDGMVAGGCCRWISLRSAPEVGNSTTVNIRVPMSNVSGRVPPPQTSPGRRLCI